MSSVDTLISKLATGASTEQQNDSVGSATQLVDPVYVEKLASAVDYIVDSTTAHQEDLMKQASAESVNEFTQSLKSRLQEKLASKKQEGSNETELMSNILTRLKQLKHSPVEEHEEKTAEAIEDVAEYDLSQDQEVGDESLADILSEALNADELNESVPSEENVKTAESRGDSPLAKNEATRMLKGKLLAKLGREA